MNTSEHDFAYVAFWQFLTFFALMLTIWVNEIWDLAALVYGTTPQPPNIFNASILSAAVIAIAIVTVLHTYHQQQRIIRGLLTICSYCHKVKVDDKLWKQIESFVADRSLAAFSHGICPECFCKVMPSAEGQATLAEFHHA
jgi:hypothetical protein